MHESITEAIKSMLHKHYGIILTPDYDTINDIINIIQKHYTPKWVELNQLNDHAKAALPGLIIHYGDGYLKGEYEGSASNPSNLAKDAFEIAEAMLEEYKRRESEMLK